MLNTCIIFVLFISGIEMKKVQIVALALEHGPVALTLVPLPLVITIKAQLKTLDQIGTI